MTASPTQIADGVWRITRGVPLRINVFFVRDGDALRSSTRAISRWARPCAPRPTRSAAQRA